jgi:hypothetical protein
VGDWLLNLPVLWMAVVVFAATYLLAASIFWVVTTLAVDDRARAFKAVSPGMLPPLGILFALLVGFIAVEVWGSFDKAKPRLLRRPAPFALSLYSPERSPKNRKRASMLW